MWFFRELTWSAGPVWTISSITDVPDGYFPIHTSCISGFCTGNGRCISNYQLTTSCIWRHIKVKCRYIVFAVWVIRCLRIYCLAHRNSLSILYYIRYRFSASIRTSDSHLNRRRVKLLQICHVIPDMHVAQISRLVAFVGANCKCISHGSTWLPLTICINITYFCCLSNRNLLLLFKWNRILCTGPLVIIGQTSIIGDSLCSINASFLGLCLCYCLCSVSNGSRTVLRCCKCIVKYLRCIRAKTGIIYPPDSTRRHCFSSSVSICDGNCSFKRLKICHIVDYVQLI